jgi:hypothetical protein
VENKSENILTQMVEIMANGILSNQCKKAELLYPLAYPKRQP